jgi:hypothetical protein
MAVTQVGGLSLAGNLGVGATKATLTNAISLPMGNANYTPIKFTEGIAPTNSICGQMFYDGYLGMDLCGGVRSYAGMVCWNKSSTDVITKWAAPPQVLADCVSIITGTTGIGTRTLSSGLMRVGTIVRTILRGLISTPSGSTTSLMAVTLTSGTGTVFTIYSGSLGLGNITNGIAEITLDCRIDSIGVNGSATAIGRAISGSSGNSVITRVIFGQGTVDTTTSQTFDIMYCFGAAGCSLTVYIATIEVIY